MSFLSHLSLKPANRSFAKNSTVFSYTLNLFLSCMKDFLVYMEGQCLSILHTSIDMLLFFVLFFFFVFRQKKAQAWRKPALTGESIWKRRGPVQLLTHRSNMWVTSFLLLICLRGWEGCLQEDAKLTGRKGMRRKEKFGQDFLEMQRRCGSEFDFHRGLQERWALL